jgi:hypothetical protein
MTTILLREDVEYDLVLRVGPRHLPDAINEILAKALFFTEPISFGSDPWLIARALRDE